VAIDGTAVELKIKAYIGISCKITVLQPNGVERTQTGKARRMVDKRKLN
jgi:phenylacetate-CoA ligase